MLEITVLYFNRLYISPCPTNFYLIFLILRSVIPVVRVELIQGVTGGTDQTSGECSLGQTIPI